MKFGEPMVNFLVFRNGIGKRHHAQHNRKEGIGDIYKIYCTGQEFYLGLFRNTGMITDKPVSCKRCIKKRKGVIERAVASGVLSEPIEEAEA